MNVNGKLGGAWFGPLRLDRKADRRVFIETVRTLEGFSDAEKAECFHARLAPMTEDEIALVLGVSQQRVQQICATALGYKLRRNPRLRRLHRESLEGRAGAYQARGFEVQGVA